MKHPTRLALVLLALALPMPGVADDPDYTVTIQSDQVLACPGDPLFFTAVPSVTLVNPTFRWFVKEGDGEFALSGVYEGYTFAIDEMPDADLYLYVECEDKPKPGAPTRPGKVRSEVFEVAKSTVSSNVPLGRRTTTGEFFRGTDFNYKFGASSVDWNSNPPAGLEEYFSEQGIQFRGREGSLENQTELGVSLWIDDKLKLNSKNKFYVQRPRGDQGVNADLFDLRFDADKFSGRNYAFAMRFYLILPPGGCSVGSGAKLIARTGHGTQSEDHIVVRLYFDPTDTLLATYTAEKGTGVSWYEFANDLNTHYNRPEIRSAGAIYRFEMEYFGYLPPIPGVSAYSFQPYFEDFPKCATVAIDYISAQAESVCVAPRSARVGDSITAHAGGFHADEAVFQWRKYTDQTYTREVDMEEDEIVFHTNAYGRASQADIKMKSAGVFFYSVQNTNPGETGISEPLKFALVGRDAWQTVTFNPEGGACATATNRYKCREPYGDLPEPSWALRTFDGWQTWEGITVTATNIVTDDAKLTLYANWLAGVTTNGVFWYCAENQDGSATVTGAEPAKGDLAVPGELDGCPVTAVGAGAFANCGAITNAWLGTHIERVGTNAFAGCTNLATVWAPVEKKGTGLLDAAGVPEGCAIRYYGTQTVTFDPAGGTCAVARAGYEIGQPYGWLPEATWPQHTFDGWWAPEEVSGDTNAYDVVYDLVPQGKDYTAAPANGEGRNVYRATAGETLTIDWTVKNDPGTAGLQIFLDFSPVEYVSAKIGNGYRVQPQFNDTNANVSKGEDPTVGGVVAYAFGGDSEKTARDGAVIYSFTVKAPEREGIYSIVKDDRSPTKVVPKDQSRPHDVLVHGLDIVVGDPAPDEPIVLAEVTTNSVVTAEAARTLRARWAVPPPVVSNVVARQRWPWNGLVDVDYEIGGTTSGLVVRISFEEQGGEGRTWGATNFLGNARPTADPGPHRATWDTKAAGVTNVVAANVVATVSLVDPRRNEPGPAPSSEPSASEDQSPIRGDVDCSGDVDVADAVLLARYLAEDSGAHVSAQGILNADVNGSGFPDSTDVTTILKYIVHLIAEL